MAKKNSNFFGRAISRLNASKEKKEAILPYSKTSDDLSEIAFNDTTYFQKASGKKQLEILYRNSWVCHKAINVRANLLSARGMKIVCNSDKSKEVVTKMLLNMHPTRPLLALQLSFRNRSINVDVFGNAFDEKLFAPDSLPIEKAKSFNGFTVIHPIHIDFHRDAMGNRILFEDGVPKGWRFNRDPSWITEGTDLPLDRVGHLKYNSIGDELLGISTLEPVFKTAERLMKIEEGMAQGVLTYGNPTRDFIVGDESHPSTKPMIDAVADAVQNFNLKSEYVHPPWIRVGQLEAFSLSKIPNYMQPFITAIAAATGVPEFIITGRGEGTNRATAQAMINFIHQTIEPLQQAQALYFEEEILSPLMKINGIEEVPEIEWNDILPKDPNDYANIIQVLSTAMADGLSIATREELREMAGFTSETGFKILSKSKSENSSVPKSTLVKDAKL